MSVCFLWHCVQTEHITNLVIYVPKYFVVVFSAWKTIVQSVHTCVHYFAAAVNNRHNCKMCYYKSICVCVFVVVVVVVVFTTVKGHYEKNKAQIPSCR